MRLVLTGFTQDLGFRVFAFERIEADWTRTACTVRADLAMSRRYGIQIQELPLLCRSLLERHDQSDGLHTLTFTENEMWRHTMERTAAREEAALKRKQRRPMIGNHAGDGVRTS